MQKRYNESSWVDVAENKRWNGAAWQDCDFVRRWNGSAWVDVWTGKYFTTQFKTGNSVASISNGIWSASIQGDGTNHQVSLWIVPPTAFIAPLTLEVDCDFAATNGGTVTTLYIGNFADDLHYLNGAYYNSPFSRQIKTVDVAYNAATYGMGVTLGMTGSSSAYESCHVYGIKVNGTSVPIR